MESIVKLIFLNEISKNYWPTNIKYFIYDVYCLRYLKCLGYIVPHRNFPIFLLDGTFDPFIDFHGTCAELIKHIFFY